MLRPNRLALPPAVPVGATVTGERIPPRTYRRRPIRATGRVRRVTPHAIEVSTTDGVYLVSASSSRTVSP